MKKQKEKYSYHDKGGVSMSKVKRYIAMVLSTMMIFNMVTVYADTIELDMDATVSLVNAKIDSELQQVMDEAADDELISVCL